MNDSPRSQTLQTRKAIRHAALGLFNAQGATRVTTHDIAHAAGISPGNLYYHFKNKEMIIRDLFSEMELYSRGEWASKGIDNPHTNFSAFMRFIFSNLWTYRFFFREFSTLLNNDETLKKMWRSHNETLAEVLTKTAKHWVKEGIMKSFSSDKEVSHFVESSWFIAHFSMSYIEARRQQNEKEIYAQWVNMFINHLRPYHTPRGQRALELYSI